MTDFTALKSQIEALIGRAAEADANDAMKFTQAATNAGQAMCMLRDIEIGMWGVVAVICLLPFATLPFKIVISTHIHIQHKERNVFPAYKERREWCFLQRSDFSSNLSRDFARQGFQVVR